MRYGAEVMVMLSYRFLFIRNNLPVEVFHYHNHHHYHHVLSPQLASTLSDQHLFSRATALATSQLFHLALFHSFSTVLLRVAFGVPLWCPP